MVPSALAEGDVREAFATAKTAQDDLVAVFECAAGFAIGKRDWLLAASGELQQASGGCFFETGDSARGKQVAGQQVAAVAGVMGDELCRSPVEARADSTG